MSVIKHRWPNDENINENQFGMSKETQAKLIFLL